METPTPAPVTVTLYGKPDCHLCEEAKGVVRAVQAEHPFRLEKVDIAGDPDLERAYGTEIPVVLVNGKKAFKVRVEAARLARLVRRGGAGRGFWRRREGR